MSDIMTFLATNPYRPPDWCWRLAKSLQERRARLTRAHGSAHVALARQFASEWDSAADELQQFSVAQKHPALYQALTIYQATTSRRCRWELEARLLAAEPYPDIAKKTGLSPAAIEHYAKIFFDVAGKPASYIANVVLGEAATRGFSERDTDVLWKFFGYWCGPIAVDFLVYGINRPSKPDSPQAFSAFLATDRSEQLRLKAWLAVRAAQINPETPPAVLRLLVQMMEEEKHADTSGDLNEEMKAGIQGLLESLPWTTDPAWEKRFRGDIPDNGVDLRPHEAMLIAAGQKPPNLDAIVASAAFPHNRKPTTDSK